MSIRKRKVCLTNNPPRGHNNVNPRIHPFGRHPRGACNSRRSRMKTITRLAMGPIVLAALFAATLASGAGGNRWQIRRQRDRRQARRDRDRRDRDRRQVGRQRDRQTAIHAKAGSSPDAGIARADVPARRVDQAGRARQFHPPAAGRAQGPRATDRRADEGRAREPEQARPVERHDPDQASARQACRTEESAHRHRPRNAACPRAAAAIAGRHRPSRSGDQRRAAPAR